MKQRKRGVLKRRLIAIASAVIVLSLLTGVVSYAEFTKSNRAKRVIASVEAAGALFSSNFLLYTEGDTATISNTKTLYTGSETQPVVTTVTVCNYAQGNPAKVYERDITYTLTARLVWVENGTKRDATAAEIGDLSVTLNFKNGGNVTLDSTNRSRVFGPSTLDHSLSHPDSCHIEFSTGFNTQTGNVRLYLIADPTVDYGDITMLDAAFGTDVSHEQQSVRWEGYVNESGARGADNASPPTAFDGFRYVITGSGVGTIRLSWKHDLVHPNTLFLDEINQTPTVSGEWSYVDFSVDSDVISRYDTQFYYSDDVMEAGTLATWATVNGSITCVYTEA